MRVVTKITDIQAELIEEKKNGKSIGFVPTMGFLHEGHISLIKQARNNNDIVVLSIFVNPLQFGPNEDYDKYPRDFDRDQMLAKEAGVDVLFYPTVVEMYGATKTVAVHVEDRTDVLCGKSRPGHFDGVATVLTKLINITMPTRAYFGLKDAQQVAVVEGLIHDFHFPIELVGVDIKRDEDGLALSSRNVNLTKEERQEAPHLHRSLLKVKKAICEGVPIAEAVEMEKAKLESQLSGSIDYYELLSYPELKQPDSTSKRLIVALAVFYKSVRLIDNEIFDLQ